MVSSHTRNTNKARQKQGQRHETSSKSPKTKSLAGKHHSKLDPFENTTSEEGEKAKKSD